MVSRKRKLKVLKGLLSLQVICHLADRECFHVRAKCAIRMIIRVAIILITVFWPVCMQISITKEG